MSELPGGGSGYKFYGTPSPQTGAIWYKSTNDGFGWNPSFTNCTGPITSNGIQADPAVLKLNSSNYLMIYVSKNSLLTSINEEKNTDKLIVYPNPNKDQIYFNNLFGAGIIQITITNIEGKTVIKQNLQNPFVLNHQLPKGIYYIEAIANNEVIREKLVVD